MTTCRQPTPGRAGLEWPGARWLNRRFWSSVGRHLARWRTPLGVVTWAAVASALCGAFLHLQGFVACAGLVAVLAVGLASPGSASAAWRGVRFESARGREGEPFRPCSRSGTGSPGPAGA